MRRLSLWLLIIKVKRRATGRNTFAQELLEHKKTRGNASVKIKAHYTPNQLEKLLNPHGVLELTDKILAPKDIFSSISLG